MTYSDKLKHPKWQKKRLEILQRDNFTCTLCGDIETTLNVHHEQYKGEPWDVPNELLKTVCEHCHEIIHELSDREIVKVHKIKNPKFFYFMFFAYSPNGVMCLTKFGCEEIKLFYVMDSDILELVYQNKPF